MAKYNNVKEITQAFIKQGWNKTITFTELTYEEAVRMGAEFLMRDNKHKEHRYFVMHSSGNIFDNNGKLVLFGGLKVKHET